MPPPVTRRDLFFSCPLNVSPCRASISAVKDGAPDAASLSARALCRMSPVGCGRCGHFISYCC
uniref:Agouti domain-containing protein n=1 Tax=Anabas testudineus TaxID=64144 RepID=A0AAQ6IQ83_ANATE